MTKSQAGDLVAYMLVAFPNFKPDVPTSMIIDMWAVQFADCPYDVVLQALNDFIRTDTKNFAPSIGQIINAISAQTHKDDLTDAEAWVLVTKAAEKATYYAEEEFNRLPKLVQKAVGSAHALKEYALMDIDEFQTVQKSLFQRTYRGVVEQDRAMEKTGDGLKRLAERAQAEIPQNTPNKAIGTF